MPPCPHCGNHPVAHAAARVSEILQTLTGPLERVIYGPIGHACERCWGPLLPPLVKGAAAMGVVRFNDDPARALNDRARVVWEEALRRGIAMRQMIVCGRPTDAYEVTANGRARIVEGIPLPSHLSLRSLPWLDDKERLRRRLAASGIPVPRGGVFRRFSPMRALFEKLQKPVIVKPARGSRGRHTTTGIRTVEQLRCAFDVGKQIAGRLILEEQLTGSVYRATIVGGRLTGLLRGDPPRVRGDGTHTILELIAEKNRTRHPRVAEYAITPLTGEFLARAGHALDDIPADGELIDLSEKIGLTYGGSSAEELPLCHPRTRAILEKAGRIVGFPVMGFDFIIEDIAEDPHAQHWGIIECNSLPFIDLHHFPLEGAAVNVAKAVWDLWERDAR